MPPSPPRIPLGQHSSFLHSRHLLLIGAVPAPRHPRPHSAQGNMSPTAVNKEAFEAANAKFAAQFDKAGDGTKPLPPAKKVGADLTWAT